MLADVESKILRRCDAAVSRALRLVLAQVVAMATWVTWLPPCSALENAQPNVVRMPDGVEFTIPAGLRETTVPKPTSTGSGAAEHAYVDTSSPPLRLFVLRSEAQRRSTLPLVSETATQDLTNGFMAGTRKTLTSADVYEVGPGTYEPEQSSFTVFFKTRADSRAKQLLDEPDSSPNWQEIQRTGANPTQLRCVFKHLLGGSNAIGKAGLGANYEAASRSCGWSLERVTQYVATVGPGLFAIDESAVGTVAFFTRSALVVVSISAPVARAQDVRAVAKLILSSARISPEAKPKVTILNDLDNASPMIVGRLIGTILGPFFAVIFIGALLARVLTRFGVTPARAGMVACTLLMLLGVFMALSTPEFSIFTICQLASYLLAGLIAIRPMTKWLSTKHHPRAAGA
jgi:hypothetical protein